MKKTRGERREEERRGNKGRYGKTEDEEGGGTKKEVEKEEMREGKRKSWKKKR